MSDLLVNELGKRLSEMQSHIIRLPKLQLKESIHRLRTRMSDNYGEKQNYFSMKTRNQANQSQRDNSQIIPMNKNNISCTIEPLEPIRFIRRSRIDEVSRSLNTRDIAGAYSSST